ncbi:MAG: 4-(cytidine 5'-diphospho)-2-C-methyl-D-erythritol kinase, partial [Alphaproteobacteria bacterium]|nr:4-(cytidine 5'-diphospho)-2-C-methyl-D-erythritol kinase [Alphaproteobacteria bacterium]
MTTALLAPAKINLTLHVTGRRADGYHLLDSLVAFADIGDRISIAPAPDLRLHVTGPFAAGLPTDAGNLVLRAAQVLRGARTIGADVTLEKNLPVASGIGGGSSDAATTVLALSRLWNVPLDLAVATLGADIPVCLRRKPTRMAGIGEILTDVSPLPKCGIALVNPGVPLAT